MAEAARRRRAEDAPRILAEVDWDRNPGFIVTDLQRLIVAAVDEQLRPLDLTNAQLRVILHLTANKGATQVALAEQIGINKASLGILVDRLAEKGLVERRPHPDDRRANLIFLTEKVDGLYGRIFETGTFVMEALMRDITPAEQKTLVDLLLRLKANAKRLVKEKGQADGE